MIRTANNMPPPTHKYYRGNNRYCTFSCSTCRYRAVAAGERKNTRAEQEAGIKRAYKRTDTLLNTADTQFVNCGTIDGLPNPASP